MPTGTDILHKKKATDFIPGDLGPGELGVQTTNGHVYYSANGVGVVDLNAFIAANIVPAVSFAYHQADANFVRPACGMCIWIGTAVPVNKVAPDIVITP